jgi:hypothetical protein
MAEAAPVFTRLAIIESAVGFPCADIVFRDKKKKCRKYEQVLLFTP